MNIMWVRLTSLQGKPDQANELKRIYHERVAPEVKSQPGVKGAFLLEPADEQGEFISATIWDSRESAEAYEASGTYRRLVDQVREMVEGPPTLRSYEVKGEGLS
jgi:heme-degrading monooxygenase HmoA